MIEQLSDAAHELLGSDAVATVVTLNADGSPHVSVAWVGIEDGEIVIGTLSDQRKLANIRRDPRVALSPRPAAGRSPYAPGLAQATGSARGTTSSRSQALRCGS